MQESSACTEVNNMPTVVKRDGTKEEFDINKVKRSIKKAVIDAGLTIKEKTDVIGEVSRAALETAKEKSEVTAEALREQILTHLDKAASEVSEAWRQFDTRYKNS